MYNWTGLCIEGGGPSGPGGVASWCLGIFSIICPIQCEVSLFLSPPSWSLQSLPTYYPGSYSSYPAQTPAPTFPLPFSLPLKVGQHYFPGAQQLSNSRHSLSKTVRAKDLKIWENVYPPPCETCHVSCVMYHVWCVMCDVSCVMYQVFLVRCHHFILTNKSS